MIIGRVLSPKAGIGDALVARVIIPGASVATAFEAALLGAQALRGAGGARCALPAGVSMVLLMAVLLLVMAPEFAASGSEQRAYEAGLAVTSAVALL